MKRMRGELGSSCGRGCICSKMAALKSNQSFFNVVPNLNKCYLLTFSKWSASRPCFHIPHEQTLGDGGEEDSSSYNSWHVNDESAAAFRPTVEITKHCSSNRVNLLLLHRNSPLASYTARSRQRHSTFMKVSVLVWKICWRAVTANITLHFSWALMVNDG